MKKILGILCSFLFVIVAVGCSCKKDDNNKASLGVGDMNASTYQTISLSEVDAKVDNKDTFILYVYSPTCGGCIAFKPILENVIKSKNLIVYALLYSDITSGHELKSLSGTPSVVVYKEGEILTKINSNKDSDYFKNNDSFISFLDKYTYMPTMYYINKNQLKEKIANEENFIIYYSRNDCGDCSYMYNYYLKGFLYNNPNTRKIYVIETNVEGIRYLNGVAANSSNNATEEELAAAEQWQLFKNEFGLSEEGNSTFGYGVGYVPTIQYYNNGRIADMVVYFNDEMSYAENSDGSLTVTINDSYYSDNPYIGESMLYSDYKNTLAPFYNGKLTAFINNYLGLVD